MSNTNPPPAGWYQDQKLSHLKRYWDGAKWTDHLFNPETKERTTASIRQDMIQSSVIDTSKEYPQEQVVSKNLPSSRNETQVDGLKEYPKITTFNGKSIALELIEENKNLYRQNNLMVKDIEELRGIPSHEVERIFAELRTQQGQLERSINEKYLELNQLRQTVLDMTEEGILQEVGFYRYSHVLENSMEYKSKLEALRAEQKRMNKSGAVTAAADWTVNNSKKEGAKMVKDLSDLMLLAYNQEVETLVKAMKPTRLELSVRKLEKTVARIEKLGSLVHIKISPEYHRLRIEELKLTADYLNILEEEKEIEREAKEKLLEERKAQAELNRIKEAKEREVRQKVEARKLLVQRVAIETDPALKARAEADLVELDGEIEDIKEKIHEAEARAANLKAGFVYVISNIGAFGKGMVKIGMTRRVNPMDRVKELGDASVPFRFDVHLLQYSEDALGMERLLQNHFAKQKVNLVNSRKEFFYATPQEIEAAIKDLKLAGLVTSFIEDAEALEYRQSVNFREKQR